MSQAVMVADTKQKSAFVRHAGKLATVGTLALVAGGSALAQSSGVDVSNATNAFQNVATAVGNIGPVMLAAVAAGIVFKWVTAFLI